MAAILLADAFLSSVLSSQTVASSARLARYSRASGELFCSALLAHLPFNPEVSLRACASTGDSALSESLCPHFSRRPRDSRQPGCAVAESG